MSAVLRLFVAIYPPPEVAAALLAALEELELPPHRATRAEQVHMTAQFIGDTNERDLEAAKESVARSCAGLTAFTLTPTRLIMLPERGPPRLIAAETDAPPSLLELHRRLAHRLAKSARAREDERFLPHMTLARFAGGGAAVRRVEHPLTGAGFVARNIVLVRSVLHTEGAEHRRVAECSLDS